MPDITCNSCGLHFKTRYKRQKYCGACITLRDLNNNIGPRKCKSCATTFYPIRQTHVMCAGCHMSTGRLDVECGVCGQTRRGVPGVPNLCLACTTSTRPMRDKYKITLKIVLGRRRRDLQDPPPQPIE